MRRIATRHHRGYAAFVAHRLSGLALALFLPAHFLALGTALEGAAGLERFLDFAALPWVKASEWGLVVLLAVHLGLGARLLAIELLPWRGLRLRWIGLGAAGVLAFGAILAMRMV